MIFGINITRDNHTWYLCQISLQIMLLPIQYVVLGPRVKVINLNILPESSRNELKYSLKIAFMFLSIILKKKATIFDGPWSANVVLGLRLRQAARKKRKNVIVSTRKRDFHSISCIFFLFLMQLS